MTHVSEDFGGAPSSMDPRSAYGEGKRVAELLCAIYAQRHGLEAKVARCFAFVGPYLPLDGYFAIGNFIRDALRGGPIAVSGDGTPYRSYLYAADLAVWLWTILFRGQSCRPYNVGADNGMSIAEVATAVAAAREMSPLAIKVQRKAIPGQPPQRYVPATGRARAELGLVPMFSLRPGLLRDLAYRTQPSE